MLLFLTITFYTSFSQSCCCRSRKSNSLMIKSRLYDTIHFYKISQKTTLSEIRSAILRHQSEILKDKQWLKYKESDYYVAIYNHRGDKIITVNNDLTPIGKTAAAICQKNIIINVAPRPYCKPIIIKPY